MSDELVRALQQIQQQADAVRRLIVDAQTFAPARAEGDDASGGLSLIVGPDGLPESLRVAADWRDRLTPGHFADAVLEAFAAASEGRMAVWMRALAAGDWQGRFEQLRRSIDNPHQTDPSTPTPRPQPPQRPASVRPRDLNGLAEEMIRAFGSLDPTPPAMGTCTDASGNMTIAVSATALESCTVRVGWVSQQRADTLTNAFRQAVIAARGHLSQTSPAPSPTPEVASLLNQAMAFLQDPHRLSDFGTERSP